VIRDNELRRHYQRVFKDRIYRSFGRGVDCSSAGATKRDGGRNNAWQRSSRPNAIFDPKTSFASPPLVSSSLATSPLFHPGTLGLPPREGLILLLLLNHPGLISLHIEDLAEIEFSSGEAAALRDALLASPAARPGQSPLSQALAESSTDAPNLRAAVEGQGFGPILQKLDLMAAHGSHWYAKAGAAEADAEEVLKQALNLHRRAKALHRELQLAELALGKESSEANLGRLKDIQAQLAALGGIEAGREGFGMQSGRPSGTL
jgi:DNA primase